MSRGGFPDSRGFDRGVPFESLLGRPERAHQAVLVDEIAEDVRVVEAARVTFLRSWRSSEDAPVAGVPWLQRIWWPAKDDQVALAALGRNSPVISRSVGHHGFTAALSSKRGIDRNMHPGALHVEMHSRRQKHRLAAPI